MPYRLQDHWSRPAQKYLKEIEKTISTSAWKLYRRVIRQAGKMLGYPEPKKLTLQRMKEYECALTGMDSTISIKAHVLKMFLVDQGNKEARRWKITHIQRPKVDGIFLTEEQVAICRMAARQLGPIHELTFSLGIDNGLRLIDQKRLSLKNAEELLGSSRTSMILGKGRNGGKPGPLVLSKMTAEPLRQFLEMRARAIKKYNLGPRPELLIVEWRTNPPGVGVMSECTMRRYNQEVCELAGIKFGTHDRRRSYGKRLRKAGLPIETVAKCLRQENINTAFKAYIGISGDELTEAQDRLS